MQEELPSPDPLQTLDDRVSDAATDNWVDRYAPTGMRPYLRLSRADRPIGTWLLLLPCWWSLALALLHDESPRWEDLWIFFACGIGAFLMRGAGCTWNDIADRAIDAQVARTRSRPIPAGQVTVRGAIYWMIMQTGVAALILFTFNAAAIALGLLSLGLVAIYPFAKRFTWWPQVFLGLAFNWGALLVWAAHTGSLGLPALFLYLSGIAWTLYYDTIYAHQDIEDDAMIGVKSTARLFGKQTPAWLRGFAALTVVFMAVAVILAIGQEADPANLVIALLAPLAMGVHFAWQLWQFKLNDPGLMLTIFRGNRNTGLIPLLFLGLALYV